MYTSTCGLDGHLSAWSSFWALTICRIDLGSKQFLPSISSRCGPLSIRYIPRPIDHFNMEHGAVLLGSQEERRLVSTTGYWTARGPLSSQFQPYYVYLEHVPRCLAHLGTWACSRQLGMLASRQNCPSVHNPRIEFRLRPRNGISVMC